MEEVETDEGEVEEAGGEDDSGEEDTTEDESGFLEGDGDEGGHEGAEGDEADDIAGDTDRGGGDGDHEDDHDDIEGDVEILEGDPIAEEVLGIADTGEHGLFGLGELGLDDPLPIEADVFCMGKGGLVAFGEFEVMFGDFGEVAVCGAEGDPGIIDEHFSPGVGGPFAGILEDEAFGHAGGDTACAEEGNQEAVFSIAGGFVESAGGEGIGGAADLFIGDLLVDVVIGIADGGGEVGFRGHEFPGELDDVFGVGLYIIGGQEIFLVAFAGFDGDGCVCGGEGVFTGFCLGEEGVIDAVSIREVAGVPAGFAVPGDGVAEDIGGLLFLADALAVRLDGQDGIHVGIFAVAFDFHDQSDEVAFFGLDAGHGVAEDIDLIDDDPGGEGHQQRGEQEFDFAEVFECTHVTSRKCSGLRAAGLSCFLILGVHDTEECIFGRGCSDRDGLRVAVSGSAGDGLPLWCVEAGCGVEAVVDSRGGGERDLEFSGVCGGEGQDCRGGCRWGEELDVEPCETLAAGDIDCGGGASGLRVAEEGGQVGASVGWGGAEEVGTRREVREVEVACGIGGDWRCGLRERARDEEFHHGAADWGCGGWGGDLA
ncbi:MAG: hypothetical protein RI897_2174 [Verrucomicrobiota bacterium]